MIRKMRTNLCDAILAILAIIDVDLFVAFVHAYGAVVEAVVMGA